jgi:tetratricopeptide (TPR) repeat protein
MKQSKNTAADGEPRRSPRLASNAGEANAAERERVNASTRAPLADAPAPITSEVRAADVPPQGDVLAHAAELATIGELQEAVATYRSYLMRHPEAVPARRALASVLEQNGDHVAALGEFGRAIDAQPDDVSLLCGRAAVQMALQRYDKAEADLRRASKLDADSPEVLFNLGVLFCKKARWREAIEPLQRAAERNPANAQGHYYLGEAYNQTDQMNLALASYEEAVKLQPGNYRALKGVGIVLDKLGRPAEATVAYQRAREAQRR